MKNLKFYPYLFFIVLAITCQSVFAQGQLVSTDADNNIIGTSSFSLEILDVYVAGTREAKDAWMGAHPEDASALSDGLNAGYTLYIDITQADYDALTPEQQSVVQRNEPVEYRIIP
jgi:hypothetical protein